MSTRAWGGLRTGGPATAAGVQRVRDIGDNCPTLPGGFHPTSRRCGAAIAAFAVAADNDDAPISLSLSLTGILPSFSVSFTLYI